MDQPRGSENLEGRTALIEVGTIEITGTVTSRPGEPITISCDDRCWDAGESREVSVSIFAPDALYLFSGKATSTGRELVCDPATVVERIQRRRWPRKHLDLAVRLCPVEDGSHFAGIPGRTIDVSVGGLYVETLREVEGEGDPMIILDLPDGSTIVSGSSTVGVECAGDVWRYRLAFRDLEGDDADRLVSLTSV
jgi:PilZ domain